MPKRNKDYSSLISACLFFSLGLILVLLVGYIFHALSSQSSFQDNPGSITNRPQISADEDKPNTLKQRKNTPSTVIISSNPSIPNFSQKANRRDCKTQSTNVSDGNIDILYYQPTITPKFAHPTNYGERFSKGVDGKDLSNEPLVVVHETVISASETIQRFQTPHPNDEDQASYHTLITLDGTIIIIVPWQKRAFGAGNSAFKSNNNLETVQTNPDIPPSVNNFAYHIGLETPPNGNNNSTNHGGYTDSQYLSLAWLLSKSNTLQERITTHKDIDLSNTRTDPRSFDLNRLLNLKKIYDNFYAQNASYCQS